MFCIAILLIEIYVGDIKTNNHIGLKVVSSDYVGNYG